MAIMTHDPSKQTYQQFGRMAASGGAIILSSGAKDLPSERGSHDP